MLSDATALVRQFLQALEQRDLNKAQTFLAPNVTMEFPGGQRFGALDDLVHWASTRYRMVRKQYDQFDALAADGAIIVYCFGTLSGEWPDGKPFADIRFIDRFILRDGYIEDQKVWNDLAASR